MLKARLIIGTPLALLLVLAIFWPGQPGALIFTGLAGAAIFAAFSEYSGIADSLGIAGPHKLLKYMGVVLFLAIVYSPLVGVDGTASHPVIVWPAELVLLTIAVLICCLYVIRAENYAAALNCAAVALAGLVLVYGSLNFAVKLFFNAGLKSEGRFLLLFVAGATKASDMGAYAAGTFTSRLPGENHKIMPHISPQKSWEGLIGGILASTLTAIVIYLGLGENLQFCGKTVLDSGSAMVYGAMFGLLGFCGDITESALKRAARFDDSGAIPGLGGVLDITDSLLFVLPVFYGFAAAQVLF